jgi:DNA-binding transcriptional MerR regulator/methylmalonyl-CoA mutase cobalamin-binding subunit
MKELSDKPRGAPRHPIAVVTERTGLSQDVLRVWERRYSAVSPARGPGGQRLYTDADIERFNLLQAATRAGRSISRVARLSTESLAAMVKEDAEARERRAPSTTAISENEDVVGSALALARALDPAALDATLRRATAVMGMPAFIDSVATPLLRRIGDEWHAGRMTPAQEHLVSSLLHDILAESIRSFAKRESSRRLLVATPAGERHAIGAALVGATAAVEGWDVLYLGPDLPADEIARAAVSAGVRLVALSVIYVENRDAVLDELRRLRSQLPRDIALIVGGGAASALASELSAIGVGVESSITGFMAELRRHRGNS